MTLIDLKNRPRRTAARAAAPAPRAEPPRHSLPITSGRAWGERHARTEIGRVGRTETGWLAFVPDGPGFRAVGPFAGFVEALAAIPDEPAALDRPEPKSVPRPAPKPEPKAAGRRRR